MLPGVLAVSAPHLAPGRWAVICHGPGETATVAQIIETPTGRDPESRRVWFKGPPWSTLPSLVPATCDNRADALALAQVVNQASAAHIAAMERARTEAAVRWHDAVARALLPPLKVKPHDPSLGPPLPTVPHPFAGRMMG